MNNKITFRELQEMERMIKEKECHERDIQFIHNSTKSIKELCEEYRKDYEDNNSEAGFVLFRINLLNKILG